MIKIADTDGSGVVEFQEFMEMICDQVEVSDEEIEEAFKMFDRDNSGTINHNEVKQVIVKLLVGLDLNIFKQRMRMYKSKIAM